MDGSSWPLCARSKSLKTLLEIQFRSISFLFSYEVRIFGVYFLEKLLLNCLRHHSLNHQWPTCSANHSHLWPEGIENGRDLSFRSTRTRLVNG